MKLYLLFFSLAFNFFSCVDEANLPSPENVLQEVTEKLNSWKTVSYTATNMSSGSKSNLITKYKLKKVGYEPHLKLFFFKEMNHVVSIYYKLASLTVVEDQKKKITTFDYDNDRSVPRYLQTYMGDDDNLIVISEMLKESRNTIDSIKQETFRDRKAYVYKFQNHTLWLDVKEATPLKMDINTRASGKKEIVFEDLVFNETMDEDTFTHPKKEGYVASVFGIKKEPMLNVPAPNWSLLNLQGEEVSLGDFKGSPVFLEAWVSSCSHCMASLPKIKQIEKEFGDKVKVVTVNFDYDLDETLATVKAKNITYPVLQGDATFDRNYDIQSFPSFFVINSDGIITHSGRGAIENKKSEVLFEALKKVK